MFNNLAKASQDLVSACYSWRIFCLIGINDISKKYARSKLGQFWLTLSLAVNIGSLGIVWSYLFKTSVNNYLPYIAFSIILWSYISSCLTEGATTFISSASYLRELQIAKTSYIFSLFARQLIILGHNLLILIPIYFFCPFNLSIERLLFSIFGLILTTAFLFPAILFIATFSLRFRDLPSIINSLLQIVFYITPVMWKGDFMPEKIHKYMILNPFAVFLSLCRDQFFMDRIPAYYISAAIIYIIIAWLIAFPLFSRYRARITYWL